MTQYYRYQVSLTDGGSKVKVEVRDLSGQTIDELGGSCSLKEVPDKIARSADKIRAGSATLPEMDDLGEALFAALFPPEVQTDFRNRLAEIEGQEEVLIRLELDLDEESTPAAAALPWEFLRAPQTGYRAAIDLAKHPYMVLARRRPLWGTAKPIMLKEPLKILLIVAAPQDLRSVAFEDVAHKLAELAEKHPAQFASPLPVLKNPTLQEIEEALRKERPHLLHFVGHGRMQRVRNMSFGQLALVDTFGNADWINDEEFAEAFQVYKPSIVLLQACESGAAGSSQSFIGVASQVVHRNVPVVIAMNYTVRNVVASTFAEAFYTEVARFTPVDLAVQRARRILAGTFPNTWDFAAPLLFVRVADGRLFVSPNAEPTSPLPTSSAKPGPVILPDVAPRSIFLPESSVVDWAYPVRVACLQCNEAAVKSDAEQFHALDGLLHNLVKYLTAVAFSDYWQRPDANAAKVREWVDLLTQPRLRIWFDIYRQIFAQYRSARDHRQSVLCTHLFEPVSCPVEDDHSLLEADKELRRLQPGRPRRAECLETFIERLLAVRETHWEVDPASIAGDLRSKLLPALWPALQEAVQSFTPLLDYPLRYIEHVDPDASSTVYTLVAYRDRDGASETAAPWREPKGSAATWEPRRLYLCELEGRPLICLHPLLISYRYRLYFLENSGEPGTVSFRHCQTGERHSPPPYLKSGWSLLFQTTEDPIERLHQTNDGIQQEEDRERRENQDLRAMLGRLAPDGREALEIGLGEALRIGQNWLGVEFLLMGLSKQRGRAFEALLREIRIDPSDLRGMLRSIAAPITAYDWRGKDVGALGKEAFTRLSEWSPAPNVVLAADQAEAPPTITPRMVAVLKVAAERAGEDSIGHDVLLVAAFGNHGALPILLLLQQSHQAGWEPGRVMRWLHERAGAGPDPPVATPVGADGESPLLPGRSALRKYGRDLSDAARTGILSPVAGPSARRAVALIGQILLQREANNPLLLGDPGVGKSAVVEGFAQRLVDPSRPVHAALQGRRIIEISVGSLMAGTKYRGDLEERVEAVIAQVKKANGQIVLFIDEIHSLLSGGGSDGMHAIADALKPALSRGELPCIGATTVAEYRRHIEKDPALARRFTPVWLAEPALPEAEAIVQRVAAERLAPHHQVTFDLAAIQEAVRLSVRYLPDERLPAKAIKVLDQAAAAQALSEGEDGIPSLCGASATNPDAVRTIDRDAILQVVSTRTGIPIARLRQSDDGRLQGLESQLQRRIQGQEKAIREVVAAVQMAAAGFGNPERPQGVFLFAGPTGVGKTALALALAETLFDEERTLLRLDMSEFMEKHNVARLIGAPPGYVGHDEEGLLTAHLRRRPYSIVLLDEIEKAHVDVQNLFLQLFDAGRLTDGHGNAADGRTAYFILTTNLGAREAIGLRNEQASYQEKLQSAIRDHFSPEFLNRIDHQIYFEALTEDVVAAILRAEMEVVRKRLAEQNVGLTAVTSAALQHLATAGFDADNGARHLHRTVERLVLQPIAQQKLARAIRPGDRLTIDVVDGQLICRAESEERS